MITFCWLAEPHGSSSWPRCRQKFANPRSTPSSPRTISTPPGPTCSARMSPGSGVCALRPTHIQPLPKKCRCSQANTSSSTYAARGSILLWPNGRSASRTPARSSGAAG